MSPPLPVHSTRRALLATLLLSGLPSTAHALDLAMPSTQDLAYLETFRAAHAALARGEATQALGLFERAAQEFGDRPQAELGAQRALLLAGDFLQALGRATALVRKVPQFAEARAFLAFLHDRFGDIASASQRLERARTAWPDSLMVQAAEADLEIDRGLWQAARGRIWAWPTARARHPDILRLQRRMHLAAGDPVSDLIALVPDAAGTSASTEAFHRIWPAPFAEPWQGPPDSMPRTANAFLLDDGQHLLTSAAAVRGAGRIQLRNSGGRLLAAERRDVPLPPGLSLLALRDADHFPALPAWSGHAGAPARAGAVCVTVGFPVIDPWAGALPAVEPGFVSEAPCGDAAVLAVRSSLVAGHAGSPIFDTAGRLIGMVTEVNGIAGRSAGDLCAVAAPALAGVPGLAMAESGNAEPPPHAPEALYAALLPRIFQVFADAS